MTLYYDIIYVHGTSYQSTGIPIERFTSSLPRRRRIHPPERVQRDEWLLLLYFFILVSYIMSKRNPFFSGKYIFVWPKTVRLGRCRYRSLRRPTNTNTRRKKGRSTLVALGCRRTRCRSFREWALCASVLRRVLRSITRRPTFPARGKLQRRRRHASGW